MTASTKQKMVSGAADMISRRGVRATTLRDVVQRTGTPRGSLSHHFPGGKQQMVEEAIRYASDSVAGPLAALMDEHGAIAGLRAFVLWWQRVLEHSDFDAGCPILAVAIDSEVDVEAQSNPTSAGLRELAHLAFVRWQGILADALRKEGVASARARRLATLTVAAIEGTVALCRAERSARPLQEVQQELEAVLEAALQKP